MKRNLKQNHFKNWTHPNYPTAEENAVFLGSYSLKSDAVNHLNFRIGKENGFVKLNKCTSKYEVHKYAFAV